MIAPATAVLTAAANAALLYFWQPWAKALAEETGKLDAREAKLDAILNETKAVTEAQKKIESRLAGELWNAQTRRNETKDFYSSLLMALYKASRACTDLLRMRHMLANGEHWQQPTLDIDATISNALDNIGETQAELIRLHSLAAIFSSQFSAGVLKNYLDSDRRLRKESTAEEIIKQREKLEVVNNHIVSAAKRDLGIIEA